MASVYEMYKDIGDLLAQKKANRYAGITDAIGNVGNSVIKALAMKRAMDSGEYEQSFDEQGNMVLQKKPYLQRMMEQQGGGDIGKLLDYNGRKYSVGLNEKGEGALKDVTDNYNKETTGKRIAENTQQLADMPIEGSNPVAIQNIQNQIASDTRSLGKTPIRIKQPQEFTVPIKSEKESEVKDETIKLDDQYYVDRAKEIVLREADSKGLNIENPKLYTRSILTLANKLKQQDSQKGKQIIPASSTNSWWNEKK